MMGLCMLVMLLPLFISRLELASTVGMTQVAWYVMCGILQLPIY
jgi:hypothetical protein